MYGSPGGRLVRRWAHKLLAALRGNEPQVPGHVPAETLGHLLFH
jgi:hypothetical protein